MSSSPTTLVGNLTRDPEISSVGNGTSKISFSIACNHSWRKADGEWDEKPSFFNVVAWRQLAEDAAPILQKGVRVVVTGRLDQRTWETDDGESRNWVELVADDIAVSVKALDGITRKQRGDGAKSGGAAKRPTAQRRSPVAAPDDEPF